MKTLTTAIAASLLIAGMSAAQADTMRTTKSTIVAGQAATKDAAYQQGLNKLNQLRSAPSNVLEYQVNAPIGSVKSGTLKVTEGNNYVTVQERIGANGQKSFVSQVNVGLSYIEHDSDN